MDTKQAVARFESERQALALMDHPAIAKVFDGGSTTQGRPYFVMEYVKGVPITEHFDTHRLPTEERLKLLAQLCEGVQHAHQKAIIHRDLKPSNITPSASSRVKCSPGAFPRPVPLRALTVRGAAPASRVTTTLGSSLPRWNPAVP